MPQVDAAGTRREAFDKFKTAISNPIHRDHVALLVDSEDKIADINRPWTHLQQRKDDKWPKPKGATDEQVFLMTTCMETWIVADRAALRDHYKQHFQENALPALQNMETRDRHAVQDALARATKNCTNPYAKGKRSFEILAKLDPAVLRRHLPSFARMERILNGKLPKSK